jgi:hypothetical protein
VVVGDLGLPDFSGDVLIAPLDGLSNVAVITGETQPCRCVVTYLDGLSLTPAADVP